MLTPSVPFSLGQSVRTEAEKQETRQQRTALKNTWAIAKTACLNYELKNNIKAILSKKSRELTIAFMDMKENAIENQIVDKVFINQHAAKRRDLFLSRKMLLNSGGSARRYARKRSMKRKSVHRSSKSKRRSSKKRSSKSKRRSYKKKSLKGRRH